MQISMVTESNSVNQNIYLYSGMSDSQSPYWMGNSFKATCRVNANNYIIPLREHLIFTTKNSKKKF